LNYLKNFFIELLPVFLARKIIPGYERPEKENAAASLIRSIVFIIIFGFFLVRAYMVPTGSMKYTINENDFLLVNRFIYGVKTPDQIGIPMTNIYYAREIPSFRMTPALRDISVEDILVFRADHEEPPLEYVKRLVAAPGDSISMKNGKIYNNGKLLEPVKIAKLPQEFSESNAVQDSAEVIGRRLAMLRNLVEQAYLAHDFPFQKSTIEIMRGIIGKSLEFTYTFKEDMKNPELSNYLRQILDQAKSIRQTAQATVQESYEYLIFRGLKQYYANRYFANISSQDNFDTIYIPKEDDVLDLEKTHVDIISNVVFYDGHTFDKKGNTFYIDGEPAQKYKVEQDYYFFIGDNRHGSLDSRHWGMVPHKYIVGTPILKYFSVKDEFWNHPSRKNNSFLSKAIDLLFNLDKAVNWDQIGKLVL
jgi:signal peptidase I